MAPPGRRPFSSQPSPQTSLLTVINLRYQKRCGSSSVENQEFTALVMNRMRVH
jgi:hypothetical protein